MKILFTFLILLTFSAGMAQTVKSTGVVSLISGMTAKLDLDNSNSIATLTLTGPDDRWFALAFKDNFPGESGMASGNDLVWYNGTTLVDAVHNGTGEVPTQDDTNNWTVTSNTTSGGTRTIVATRAFNTGDSQDFIFDFDDAQIDFASARRSNASYALGNHGNNRDVFLNNPLNEVLGVNEVSTVTTGIVPNPAKNSFSIQSSKEILSIKIYDTVGKMIFSSLRKDVYDISGLSAGVYFVEILGAENNVSYQKLIKK